MEPFNTFRGGSRFIFNESGPEVIFIFDETSFENEIFMARVRMHLKMKIPGSLIIGKIARTFAFPLSSCLHNYRNSLPPTYTTNSLFFLPHGTVAPNNCTSFSP